MSSLQFETPENVSIDFRPAGLGTRFVAWFVDQILVWFATFLLIIVVLVVGSSFTFVDDIMRDVDADPSSAPFYAAAFIALVWGLGSFIYFGATELFMRGQTPGKRLSKIRVVKSDGFSLDGTSILVRNIFRVLDHLPPLWIVPLLSARGQRAGDMVAGTVVVSDDHQVLSEVRAELAQRSALESEFRFDASALRQLDVKDIQGVEMLLERWNTIPEPQRISLAQTMTQALSQKLSLDQPPAEQHVRFLEDLLAAEVRRQQRGLS